MDNIERLRLGHPLGEECHAAADELEILRSKCAELDAEVERLKKACSNSFVSGVVYSAAQIIQAHNQLVCASNLMRTVANPRDDISFCDHADIEIIRTRLQEWN